MSQHIVNVSFDFDEDRIRKLIEDNCVRQVHNKITGDIEWSVVSEYGYGYRPNKENSKPSADELRSALRQMVSNQIDDFLIKNKDTIIDATASKLAERLSKTKVVKNLKEGLASET